MVNNNVSLWFIDNLLPRLYGHHLRVKCTTFGMVTIFDVFRH